MVRFLDFLLSRSELQASHPECLRRSLVFSFLLLFLLVEVELFLQPPFSLFSVSLCFDSELASSCPDSGDVVEFLSISAADDAGKTRETVVFLHSGPENLKKVRAKKIVKSNKSTFFYVKLRFWQF